MTHRNENENRAADNHRMLFTCWPNLHLSSCEYLKHSIRKIFKAMENCELVWIFRFSICCFDFGFLLKKKKIEQCKQLELKLRSFDNRLCIFHWLRLQALLMAKWWLVLSAQVSHSMMCGEIVWIWHHEWIAQECRAKFNWPKNRLKNYNRLAFVAIIVVRLSSKVAVIYQRILRALTTNSNLWESHNESNYTTSTSIHMFSNKCFIMIISSMKSIN